MGGVLRHRVQWWTQQRKEQRNKGKRNERGEHNGRSSISLLYLLDVRNTLYACSQKHTHLSARRQRTRPENPLILAQSFNQAVCMSHMLSVSCRLIFTVVSLAGEPLCCSRTKSQSTLWTFCSAKKPLSPPVSCNNPRIPETIRLQSPPDVSPHSETWWKLMKPQGNHGRIICSRQ